MAEAARVLSQMCVETQCDPRAICRSLTNRTTMGRRICLFLVTVNPSTAPRRSVPAASRRTAAVAPSATRVLFRGRCSDAPLGVPFGVWNGARRRECADDAERILVKADLHECGPHQLRHAYASLLLKAGAPITYVSHELGHRDSYTTLKNYSHWLPDSMGEKVVDPLNQTQPTAPPRNRKRTPISAKER